MIDDLKIGYKEYHNNKNILDNLKVVDLKNVAKYNKLKISGKKSILKDRIITHFIQSEKIILIQKHFRRHICKLNILLRGPALYDKSKCINDSDFITLEKLTDIEWFDFYSIKDNDDNVYGFSLLSFLMYAKKNNVIKNPYNRNKLSNRHINTAIKLYKLTNCILGKNIFKLQVSITQTNDPYETYNTSRFYYRPRVYSHLQLTTNVRELYNKIISIRRTELNTRIQNLFIEIDRLGNYTQASWFTGLTILCYPRLYRYLFDIWNFKAELDTHSKTQICSIFDPFQNILETPISIFNNNIDNLTLQSHIKLICVTVMENLIYTGINDEYCNIGVQYCLIALTKVSHGARVMLPWLYECY